MEPQRDSLQALSRAVLNDARTEAEQIVADARAKADALRRQAEEQAATEREAILRRAHQEAERLHSQAIASAQLRARTLLLERREKLLQQVFDQARQRLAGVPQWSDYDQIVRHLIVEAVKNLDAPAVLVRADAQSQVHLTPELLDDIARETGVQIEQGAPLESGTGVVVETPDGRRRYDNTLEARLNRWQDALRAPVYRLLMGESL